MASKGLPGGLFGRRLQAAEGTTSPRRRSTAGSHQLGFESFESRRPLTVVPAGTPPAELPAAIQAAITAAGDNDTAAVWITVGTGSGTKGLPGTIEPGEVRSPPQSDTPATRGPSSAADPSLADRADRGQAKQSNAQQAQGFTGPGAGADSLPNGVALEIQRGEWTAATSVRYPLHGRAPPTGEAVELGHRRTESTVAFIDIGRGASGPAKSLRTGGMRSQPLPAAPAEPSLAGLDSSLRTGISTSSSRPVRPATRAVPASGPSLSATSRAQGMMLVASVPPQSIDGPRPGPTATSDAVPPQGPNPRPPSPREAITGQLGRWADGFQFSEMAAAEGSAPPSTPPMDDRELRHALGGLAVAVALASDYEGDARRIDRAHRLGPVISLRRGRGSR